FALLVLYLSSFGPPLFRVFFAGIGVVIPGQPLRRELPAAGERSAFDRLNRGIGKQRQPRVERVGDAGNQKLDLPVIVDPESRAPQGRSFDVNCLTRKKRSGCQPWTFENL